MSKSLRKKILLITAIAVSTKMSASSHSMINSSRLSEENITLTQALEGEFGTLSSEKNDLPEGTKATQNWRGYGFRNGLGIELFKFVHFGLNHTFLTMRNDKDALEAYSGSRITANLKLIFASPLGNLEAGGGALGGRYDYQKQLETANIYSSGYHYSLGINYFLSTRLSTFVEAKRIEEKLSRSSGSQELGGFRAKTTNLGLGLSVWL